MAGEVPEGDLSKKGGDTRSSTPPQGYIGPDIPETDGQYGMYKFVPWRPPKSYAQWQQELREGRAGITTEQIKKLAGLGILLMLL